MKSQSEWNSFWDAMPANMTVSHKIIALFQEYAKNRSWLMAWFDNRSHVTTVRKALAQLNPDEQTPQEVINILAQALYDSGDHLSWQGDMSRVFDVVLTKAGISDEALASTRKILAALCLGDVLAEHIEHILNEKVNNSKLV